MRLADSSPLVENYRVAVARQRGFVIGDLELMRQLDEQDLVAAQEKEQQAINNATQKRLHDNEVRLNTPSRIK